MMTLAELKELVDGLCKRHKGLANAQVMITLAEPSIGGRAAAQIKGIYAGFDWEHNQIRVEPEESLVRQGHTYEDPMPIRKIVFAGSNRPVYVCPKCESTVAKIDHFCRECGQRLAPPEERSKLSDYQKQIVQQKGK